MKHVTSDNRSFLSDVKCLPRTELVLVRGQMSNVRRGFTLIELLITIALLGILTLGLWQIWLVGVQVTTEKRAEVTASSIATEQLEMIRTLPYANVGTVNGIPSGTTPQQQTISRNGTNYAVKTSILYIDDPFDGVAPDDLLPTDYKRVRLEVQWTGKFGVSPVVVMTDIAPKGVETNTGGGTILLNVVTAKLEPIPDATVAIKNTSVVPPIDLILTTNSNGQILVPGAPVSTEGYDVTVTKSGYSSDGTTRPEVGVNPSPTQPPLSVFEEKVTSFRFSIDRLGTLKLRTVDNRGSSDWWRSLWPYRKNITITNTGAASPAGTPIAIDLDHATLVQQGTSLANGDDIRVVFFNGTYFEDLDRMNTSPWNTGETTRIWFATKKSIGANDDDDNYAVYYGNTEATVPLASPARIFPPPLKEDTIGLWYLDEGKGSTIARDASGYGHDGTLTSLNPETAWVDGKFGSALSFTGGCCPMPHVRIAPTPTLANVDTVTIEAWVYPTTSNGGQTIVSKIDNSKLIGTYHLDQRYKSICLFVWKNPNPYDGEGCGGTVILNAWNHVAGTYDGKYIRTYVNGTLVGTAEKPGVLSKTSWVELNIGRYSGHNWDPYYGRIDTAAIHRTARTDFAYGKPTALTAIISTERTYKQPNAIPNVTVTVTGSKIVGNDDVGRPILKFKRTITTDVNGNYTFVNQEADTYAITVDGATGYDISAALPVLPVTLSPATTTTERLTLLAHRDHTMLVTVKDKQTPLDGASVRLTAETGKYDKTIISGESGQAFFSPLTGDSVYTLTVTKPSYTTSTTNIPVNGQMFEEVAITQQ